LQALTDFRDSVAAETGHSKNREGSGRTLKEIRKHSPTGNPGQGEQVRPRREICGTSPQAMWG